MRDPGSSTVAQREAIELTRKLLELNHRLRDEMRERKFALRTSRAATRRIPIALEALKRHWQKTHPKAA